MQNVPDRTCGEQKKRGRPRGFDREAALAAAMKLFWRHGYAATSMADLTEAMGIGSPSLYAAFGSKERLYAEAVRLYGERNSPLVWSRFAAAPSARDAIEALLLDSAATLAPTDGETPPGCMVTLSAVGGEGCEDLGRIVATMRAEALATVGERLDRAVADGELPAGTDVEAVARFYLAVQAGLSIQARDGASRAALEAAARAAMAGWDGLVAGQPPPSSC